VVAAVAQTAVADGPTQTLTQWRSIWAVQDERWWPLGSFQSWPLRSSRSHGAGPGKAPWSCLLSKLAQTMLPMRLWRASIGGHGSTDIS